MKPNLKQLMVPITSAVVGGLVVLGALKLRPGFRSKVDAESQTKQNYETIYDDCFNLKWPLSTCCL